MLQKTESLYSEISFYTMTNTLWRNHYFVTESLFGVDPSLREFYISEKQQTFVIRDRINTGHRKKRPIWISTGRTDEGFNTRANDVMREILKIWKCICDHWSNIEHILWHSCVRDLYHVAAKWLGCQGFSKKYAHVILLSHWMELIVRSQQQLPSFSGDRCRRILELKSTEHRPWSPSKPAFQKVPPTRDWRYAVLIPYRTVPYRDCTVLEKK